MWVQSLIGELRSHMPLSATPPKKNEVCRVRNLGYTWKMQGSIILYSSSMMKASFTLWSVTHTKGYLATFIHLLVKLLLLFNVYWVFIMCKVSISRTFSFYNPSCPSSPLHQSPSLQFISFLASQQILKSGRQGILKVGSGCGGNRHIPFLELRRHRCHHWAAVWVTALPPDPSCTPPRESRPSM